MFAAVVVTRILETVVVTSMVIGTVVVEVTVKVSRGPLMFGAEEMVDTTVYVSMTTEVG